MKKFLLYTLLFIGALLIIGFIWIKNINNFQRDGRIEIAINESPIKIHRDENGIAYVFAENKADAIRGQGFVTAQDRLFQVEFYRALIKGELASLVGASMLQSDIKMRVLGLRENAKKHYTHLDQTAKQFLDWYCEGFNEYIRLAKDEFPVELGLLNIEAKPISPEDILSVINFIGVTHGKNLSDEILSLNLAARTDLAKALLPFNVNPDRTKPLTFPVDSRSLGFSEKRSIELAPEHPTLLPPLEFGSNNWTISEKRSKTDKVILCNDPHFDARLLPGTFHPIGLFCPEFKGVGITIPGLPGLLAGRNEYVAFGITNAYGDSQDLFIEDAAGETYLQDGKQVPFEKRKETIAVKDGENVEITIRSTVRGPIISDFEPFGIQTKDVVSLQWTQTRAQSSSLGLEQFLETKNVFEFRKALFDIDNIFFNFIMGDIEGNIAFQATGLIPQRADKNGKTPHTIDHANNWIGFIPKNELPHLINPESAWVGTANHDTRPDDYPYYYSSHFSPNYRYARMKEVFAEQQKFDSEELWQLILDCKNKQAELLCPLFIPALAKEERTKELAAILTNWKYQDDINEVGAAVYNVLYDQLANLILDDELPDDLEEAYWKNGYYWIQNLDNIILTNHQFIDNTQTEEQETLDDLIITAGIKTQQFLSQRLGKDPSNWTWGNLHTIRFSSPIRQNGIGSSFLGAEEIPKRGSNQTLNRGGYTKLPEGNFDTGWFSTFRMVADLSDNEKLLGVLSGGSAARILHPYYTAQLEAWKMDAWLPYWFSKEKVEEYSKHELILE